MYRTPLRPQSSPGASRPFGRFPSPASSWAFPGAWSPSAGLRYEASPRGSPVCSPGPPRFSPGSHRPYRNSSPTRFSATQGFFSDSPRGLGSGQRGRGDVFRRPRCYSPASHQSPQAAASDSVEKYFSPSMLQDPWSTLQPITAADAAGAKQ